MHILLNYLESKCGKFQAVDFFVPFPYKVQVLKIRQPVLLNKPPVFTLSIQSLVDTLSKL